MAAAGMSRPGKSANRRRCMRRSSRRPRAISSASLAGVVVGQATHLVVIDYHPQVTLRTRVTKLEDGRVFDVSGAQDPAERHVELALACTEFLGE